MNSHPIGRVESTMNPCPKELWVLLTLADDEVAPNGPPIPLGIQSHLNHCASCRTVAARIEGVRAGLAVLRQDEVAASMEDAADRRARTALREGGRMTGRTAVPDDVDELFPPRSPSRLGSLGKLAWAASIVLATTSLAILWSGRETSNPLKSGQSNPSCIQVAENPGSKSTKPVAEPLGADEPIPPLSQVEAAEYADAKAPVPNFKDAVHRDHLYDDPSGIILLRNHEEEILEFLKIDIRPQTVSNPPQSSPR